MMTPAQHYSLSTWRRASRLAARCCRWFPGRGPNRSYARYPCESASSCVVRERDPWGPHRRPVCCNGPGNAFKTAARRRLIPPKLLGKPWARRSRDSKMLLALEGAALSRKHDYAVSIGVTAIILGLFVIGGITFTYMTRPALIEGAAKRVMDIRQLFEETFR